MSDTIKVVVSKTFLYDIVAQAGLAMQHIKSQNDSNELIKQEFNEYIQMFGNVKLARATLFERLTINKIKIYEYLPLVPPKHKNNMKLLKQNSITFYICKNNDEIVYIIPCLYNTCEFLLNFLLNKLKKYGNKIMIM